MDRQQVSKHPDRPLPLIAWDGDETPQVSALWEYRCRQLVIKTWLSHLRSNDVRTPCVQFRRPGKSNFIWKLKLHVFVVFLTSWHKEHRAVPELYDAGSFLCRVMDLYIHKRPWIEFYRSVLFHPVCSRGCKRCPTAHQGRQHRSAGICY